MFAILNCKSWDRSRLVQTTDQRLSYVTGTSQCSSDILVLQGCVLQGCSEQSLRATVLPRCLSLDSAPARHALLADNARAAPSSSSQLAHIVTPSSLSLVDIPPTDDLASTTQRHTMSSVNHMPNVFLSLTF